MSGTKCCIKQQDQRDNEDWEGLERDERVGGKKQNLYCREEAECQRDEGLPGTQTQHPASSCMLFRVDEISVWPAGLKVAGIGFIWLWVHVQETSNSCTRCQWNGPSVLRRSRHLLCRQPDNPGDKGVSCQSDNHQTSLSLPPPWQPHGLQGQKANVVTDADPGPVFTLFRADVATCELTLDLSQ